MEAGIRLIFWAAAKLYLTGLYGWIRQVGQNRFHRGFDVPKNGTAKPPAPLVAIRLKLLFDILRDNDG